MARGSGNRTSFLRFKSNLSAWVCYRDGFCLNLYYLMLGLRLFDRWSPPTPGATLRFARAAPLPCAVFLESYSPPLSPSRVPFLTDYFSLLRPSLMSSSRVTALGRSSLKYSFIYLWSRSNSLANAVSFDMSICRLASIPYLRIPTPRESGSVTGADRRRSSEVAKLKIIYTGSRTSLSLARIVTTRHL